MVLPLLRSFFRPSSVRASLPPGCLASILAAFLTSYLGGASSAHTDLTHLRAHILSALAPHLRTHPIGGTQVRTRALSRMLLRIRNFTPALLTEKGRQLGMATSFSKFYPPVAHQRVSQLGITFSKCYTCLAHKRVSQVEMATSFSKFYPRVADQRVSQLGRATSFSKFYPCMAHKRVSQVGRATFFPNFTHAWPTKG